jgi:activator of HSP90 ATPase
MDSFEIREFIPAKPEKLYDAWLDSRLHGEMTGSKAEIDPSVGGKFAAWDGYITGTIIELVPGRKIVQRWRTAEFPPASPDSIDTIIFTAVDDGTRLMLNHRGLPEGQGDKYRQGWKDYYLDPVKEYFA